MDTKSIEDEPAIIGGKWVRTCLNAQNVDEEDDEKQRVG
jgi:hypothetical protein